MSLEINKLHLGDCLEMMRNIPSESVELVLTDPPYNVDYKYNEYKDNLSFEDYLSWQLDIFSEAQRILKQNGSMFYLNYPEFNSYIYCNLDANFELKPIEIIGWFYNTHNGGNPLRKGFRTWIWATKGDPINNFYGEYENKQDKRVKKLIEAGKKPKMMDFFNMQQVKNVSKEKIQHPCQLPLSMVKKIIKSSTNENDLVVDCFSGSGTTAIAAIETKRNWICIEKDEKYYKKSLKRIETRLQQTEMF